jgi:hypothetical protein
MKGDFSNWRDESKHNFVGVLQQQGKVFLDGDWNAQTKTNVVWQDQAAQDVVGTSVAAVPAEAPDGFKITGASISGINKADIVISAGRVWADGWLVRLDGNAPITRSATYLEQPPVPLAAGLAQPLRDAVILELWREEINGFQLPDLLIEPALGGPDTTERVHTAMAFRLLRLDADETCESIIPRLQDDFAGKGRLTVKLQDPKPGSGDCPVATGGGYTGFEHNLYRIEIAWIAPGKSTSPMFKWSPFNGGLVGRGDFDPINHNVHITANPMAIQSAGSKAFYLEAVAYNDKLGYWQVVYAAKVNIDADDKIVLPVAGSADEWLGSIPTGALFFRLWGGLLPVADFVPGTKQLQDGIFLQFEDPASHSYKPGDYWTFPVRAGEIPNNQILVDNRPPEGIHYRRIPLAVLSWKQSPVAVGDIEDCRRQFQPLTRLSTCCSYRVGDGMHSHGDFDSIQEAINHLPAEGGEICVLPGLYKENIRIFNQRNIVIKGCGPRSRLQATGKVSQDSATPGDTDPAILILESQHIRIECLAVEAHDSGAGIVLEGPPQEADVREDQFLRHICLHGLEISAKGRSAIDVHVGRFITITDCRVEMADVVNARPAIYFVGDDGLIEHNCVQVIPAPAELVVAELTVEIQHSRGGIHIGGGSERVRIACNLIEGGTGDGITLGSVDQQKDGKIIIFYWPWWLFFLPKREDCAPPPVFIPGGIAIDLTTAVAGAPLSDITIQGNRIRDMGRNGIGADAFFDLESYDEMISVKGLTIIGNDIRRCLSRPFDDIPDNMIDSMGYGGISLADVEDLTIRDNTIENNGRDNLQPVCGIFLLHGEGVEISRNRIANNGPYALSDNRAFTAYVARTARGAKPGRRGGINIVYAIAPYFHSEPGNLNSANPIPFPAGRPAVKIHDNIVSAPLGQALSMGALGPVSVLGNQFTSLGVVQNPNSPSFWAATVGILNLGLSNELWFQLMAFFAIRQGQVKTPTPTVAADTAIAVPGPGLEDAKLGQYLANGNVLFSNNQCQLNLLETGQTLALTSAAIFSLDDVGFLGNQCDCELYDDFVIAQVAVFGASVRVSGNRFKEPLLRAIWSTMSFGILNTTTDNQSTHCLLVRGGRVVNSSNLEVVNASASTDLCGRYVGVQKNWGVMVAR